MFTRDQMYIKLKVMFTHEQNYVKYQDISIS